MTNSLNYCNTSQGTCQDTEPSPNMTINQLPDEVLLDIFDYYRQGIDPYDYEWTQNHAWINLAHVCRTWRAVMFASYSRLDLGVCVGPKRPEHIKAILSGPLPIFVDYRRFYEKITGSVFWRLRAALQHHSDRVCKIAFEGTKANLDKFFKLTNCAFPVLDSLSLQFRNSGAPTKQKFQIHFLRDQICPICICDTLNWPAFPSHPYPDFYYRQRLSPTSVYISKIDPVAHHQKQPFSLV